MDKRCAKHAKHETRIKIDLKSGIARRAGVRFQAVGT